MKKLFIVLVLILVSVMGIRAQEQTFTEMFDSLFINVSKVDATTAILYDRVVPFSELHRFSTADTSDATIFIQAYSELYRAAFVPAD